MSKRWPGNALYLVDASPYIFRAWFSLPDSLVSNDGQPVNAVYGYTVFLCDLVRRSRATSVAVAFDESLTTCFRNRIYPDYKANRELPPPDLAAQFAWCQAITRALGFATYASSEYEADDLIGTVAARRRRHGQRMVYVSSDKDLVQLVRGRDLFWDYARDRQFNSAAVRRHFGVRPEQMVDYLALTGDPVDNVPGVPGIGARTATRLLQRFGSLEHIYRGLDRVASLDLRGAAAVRDRLQRHRDAAFISQRLCRLYERAPLRAGARDLLRRRPRRAELGRLLEELGLGARLRRRIEQNFDVRL
jgi:5'-3' exonuclease